MGKKTSQKSLDTWTKQKWTTASGKKSGDTGEVYAPKKTIDALKSSPSGRKKLAAANRKKREATKKGKQFASHGLHKGKKRSEKGNPAEDKFLAKHMRMQYKKKPNMTEAERKRELAVGYSKYEKGKK